MTTRTRFPKPVFLLLALFGSIRMAAAAEPSDLERRLAELEKRVGALERENAQLRAKLAPAEEPAAPIAKGEKPPVEPPKKPDEPKVEVSGLIQAQGETGDGGDSRWEGAGDRLFLRRARIGVAAEFPEGFSAELEAELSAGLAPAGSLRARITDGFVAWNRYSFVGLKAGQFKTPFGFEETSSDKKLFTPERAMASDNLTLGRQVGVQLSGSIGKGVLTYAAGAFNGHGTNTTVNPDERFLLVGRLASRVPLPSLLGQESWVGLGGAAYSSDDTAVSLPGDFGFDSTPVSAAKDNLFTGTRRGYEGDTQLRLGPIEVWAEYLSGRFEPADELPASVVESDGWSAMLAVHAVPKLLTFVGKYEVFDPRTGHDADDDTRSFHLGLDWFIRGNDLKFQLDWMRSETGESGPSDKLIGRMQAVF